MKTIQPEILTALRALQEALWRLDVIRERVPSGEGDDQVLARVLNESAKEAMTVAYNAIESLGEFGIDLALNDGDDETFDSAFQKLKAGLLVPTSKKAA